MHNEIKDSVMSKNALHAILGFCALQLVFMLLEWTGKIPNIKDYTGKFIDNVSNFLQISQWATFYETPFFNVVTVYAGGILILGLVYQIIISLFRKVKN